MKTDKFADLRQALATFQAERAITAKWIEDEYRPWYKKPSKIEKTWLDGVKFREEHDRAQFDFECACTPDVIAALLEEVDRRSA